MKLGSLFDGSGTAPQIHRPPLECCRLQGFPDWWEDGVEGSDSARYKMWGNGMALPNMLHVMKGIARMEAEEKCT